MKCQLLSLRLLLGFVCVFPGALPAVYTSGSTTRDITSLLQIKAGGFRKDLKTGELVQAVTVTNISRQTIVGNLYLAMNNLDASIVVTSKEKKGVLSNGTAKVFSFASPSGNRPELKPGQHLTTVFRFAASNQLSIRYQPLIFQQDLGN